MKGIVIAIWAGVIIGLLICQVMILQDIRSLLQSDCAEEIPSKDGEFHKEKQEQHQKKGRLVPNPRLPQWEL